MTWKDSYDGDIDASEYETEPKKENMSAFKSKSSSKSNIPVIVAAVWLVILGGAYLVERWRRGRDGSPGDRPVR